MNEKQAREKGYLFIGIYTRSLEEAKTKAKELREQGYKAAVVTKPDSKHDNRECPPREYCPDYQQDNRC